MAHAPAAEVTVARSVEEVEALRGDAGAISWPHPDAEPEYFLTVLGSLPGVIRPHVVRVRRAGRPMMIVARLEEVELPAKIGYLAVQSPRVRCLTVVYGGVAGAETDQDAADALEVLRAALRAGDADVIRFLGLDTRSPLYAAATSIPPWACRDHGAESSLHWRAVVPDTIEEFLSRRSRNTRQNVRRYGKRFELDYRARIGLRRFGAGAERDLDPLCHDLEAIAAKTYQRGLGVGFSGSELDRRIMQLGLERDRYLAWVLAIDGAPAAFWDGTIQSGTFFIGSPGYDPAFADHRVGTWLQMRMMEDLCARADVGALDYGMGDAQYKRSFGDECWTDSTLHVFGRSIAGARAGLGRAIAHGIDRAARRAVAGAGLEQRVKRRWRRQLRSA